MSCFIVPSIILLLQQKNIEKFTVESIEKCSGCFRLYGKNLNHCPCCGKENQSQSGNLEKGDKMSEIKTKYKEYEIIFHDYNEMWTLKTYDCPSIYSNKSFSKVKEYADRLNKKNFKPFEAWLMSFRYPLPVKITVTSITPDGFCWVKYPDGRRGKEPAQSVFDDNESNGENIKQIESLRKEIDDIKNIIEGIETKLIPYKIPSEEKENE